MKFSIAGGDERFRYLAGLLRAAGHEPAEIGAADAVITRNPVTNSRLDMPSVLKGMRRDARLYLLGTGMCGIPADVHCVDLMQQETFVRKNAELTAEGALHAAMDAGDGALFGSRCLVVGYGRIGSALTRELLALGAEVCTAARRADARAAAESAGAEVCGCSESELRTAVSDAEFVFATPPVQLLTEGVLRAARKDAIILDLASPPFCVDLAAAKHLGLRAWRESGLPGRYCPKAAARLMLTEILRHESEVSI